MPDPSYPCNRHFVAAADGVPVLLPAAPEQRFQLDAAGVEAAWTRAHARRAAGLAVQPDRHLDRPATRWAASSQAVRARGGFTMVDEIYLGLSYDERFGHSALADAHGDDIISINSFSKYFSHDRLAPGLAGAARSARAGGREAGAEPLHLRRRRVAQHAALACFEPESIAEYERRRGEFQARRDFVVPALERARPARCR